MRSKTLFIFACLVTLAIPFAFAWAQRPFMQEAPILNESPIKRPGTVTTKTLTSFVGFPLVSVNLSGLAEASEIFISNPTDKKLCIQVKLRVSATAPTCSGASVCGAATTFVINASGDLGIPIPYADGLGFGIVCGNLAAAATNGELVSTMARSQ